MFKPQSTIETKHQSILNEKFHIVVFFHSCFHCGVKIRCFFSLTKLGGMEHLSVLMWIKVYYSQNTFTLLEISV